MMVQLGRRSDEQCRCRDGTRKNSCVCTRISSFLAHAAQLLALADGSIEAALVAALELYVLEPTMFKVSRSILFFCLCHSRERGKADAAR